MTFPPRSSLLFRQGNVFSPYTIDFFPHFAYNDSDLRVRYVSGTYQPASTVRGRGFFLKRISFFFHDDYSSHHSFFSACSAFLNVGTEPSRPVPLCSFAKGTLFLRKVLTFSQKSHIMIAQWRHCFGSGQICWRGVNRGARFLIFCLFFGAQSYPCRSCSSRFGISFNKNCMFFRFCASIFIINGKDLL